MGNGIQKIDPEKIPKDVQLKFDIQRIFADPEFRRASEGTQLYVLNQVDPEFSKADVGEQRYALNRHLVDTIDFSRKIEPGIPMPGTAGEIMRLAIRNAPRSLRKTIENWATPIMDSEGTIDALENLTKGIIQSRITGAKIVGKKLTGDKSETVRGKYEKYYDAVFDHYASRYGSTEKALKTFAFDPAGFVADITSILPVRSLVKGGQISRVAKAVKKGSTPKGKLGMLASILPKAGLLGGGLNFLGGAGRLSKALSKEAVRLAPLGSAGAIHVGKVHRETLDLRRKGLAQ